MHTFSQSYARKPSTKTLYFIHVQFCINQAQFLWGKPLFGGMDVNIFEGTIQIIVT